MLEALSTGCPLPMNRELRQGDALCLEQAPPRVRVGLGQEDSQLRELGVRASLPPAPG